MAHLFGSCNPILGCKGVVPGELKANWEYILTSRLADSLSERLCAEHGVDDRTVRPKSEGVAFVKHFLCFVDILIFCKLLN